MDAKTKLGLGALTAVVLGSMVGAGIFNLPQNMAVNAGPLAVFTAWIITAVGILLLVLTLKRLADSRPDLDCGIYQYAQHGLGNYAGFNVAWGYWLSAAFANVAYAIMLNDSFGAFFPVLLQHRWPTLLFGTTLIWTVYFIVSSGVRTAHTINRCLTVLKVLSLGLVVVLLVVGFRADIFVMNFSEPLVNGTALSAQIKSSMLVTLWCFIGIEGAVMFAGRARKPSDVGRATISGFLIAWVLYVLVSLLCYGAMSRARIAGLHDPSVAYALRFVFGEWAYWAVIISVILSILGVWIAWTIVGAEVPYGATRCGIFPKSFKRCNRHGIPVWGLLISSVVMEGFFIIVLLAEDVYLTVLNITGMMVLPAYLASGWYLLRESVRGKEFRFNNKVDRLKSIFVGLGCALFCLWMIYAGGFKLLTFTSWFYLIGIGIYLRARSQNPQFANKGFTKSEWITLGVLVLLAIASIILFVNGYSPL